MRNYGGASVKRNLQFIRAFHEINAMQPSECLIAGCTEMLNAKTAATNSLSLGHSLSQLLDTELYIWVGSTTGGQTAGRTEYISILYSHSHLQLIRAGQVLLTNFGVTAFGHSNPPHVIEYPSNSPSVGKATLLSNTRGLAYVIGTYQKQKYLFGFMHEMYAVGNRGEAYRKIPEMVAAAVADAKFSLNDITVIIGGDFNLPPEELGTRHHKTTPSARSAQASQYLKPIYAKTVTGNAQNTTLVNPYDFWIAGGPMSPGSTSSGVNIWPLSRVAASDHAGISLELVDATL